MVASFSYANGKDDFQDTNGKTPEIKTNQHTLHAARKGAKEGYLQTMLRSYPAH